MRHPKQSLLTVCLILLLFTFPQVSRSEVNFSEYWMVNEFFERHPEQKAISEAFNLKVQAMPERIKAGSHPIKILVIYPGLQASDYWRRSVSAFEKRLKDLNVSYQLESQFTKPGSELGLQSRLIGKSLSEMPDYLIFTLDALKHQKLIERVLSHGHTKIILQNITTPLKAFSEHQPFLYVGFDHAIGTRLLIKEYQTRFPQGANYAILFGTQGYVSKIRGGLFEASMTEEKGYRLKDSYYVNFNRSLAAEATLQLLDDHQTASGQPSLDFIYAASTDIALGVLDSLKARGLEQAIQVNGWGGGSAELDSIRKKELDFTVMRMNDDNGVAMAEAIALDIIGKGHQVPTIYSGSFRQVTQTTKEKQIQRFEQRAFRYSNNDQ